MKIHFLPLAALLLTLCFANTQAQSPANAQNVFIITLDGDPATPEGISRILPIQEAAKEAIKGTPLQGAAFYMGGTAATFKDIQEGATYDLLELELSAVVMRVDKDSTGIRFVEMTHGEARTVRELVHGQQRRLLLASRRAAVDRRDHGFHR